MNLIPVAVQIHKILIDKWVSQIGFITSYQCSSLGQPKMGHNCKDVCFDYFPARICQDQTPQGREKQLDHGAELLWGAPLLCP